MKKKISNRLYKVGDLVASVNENKENKMPILGIITKSLKLKQGNLYDVEWVDDYKTEDNELWDQEQIIKFKQVLQEAINAEKSKSEKG